MNLQYFPMDRQRCTIEAESCEYKHITNTNTTTATAITAETTTTTTTVLRESKRVGLLLISFNFVSSNKVLFWQRFMDR